MDLRAFLDDYGLIAVLVGTFFEGETILVLGGIARRARRARAGRSSVASAQPRATRRAVRSPGGRAR